MRSYPTELLYGVAEFLTTLRLGDQPLATWTPATFDGTAAAVGPRPVVTTLTDQIDDEAFGIRASTPTPTDAMGGVATDVSILYRAPKGMGELAATDRAFVVFDAFRPNGRPLSHHRFGRVLIGGVFAQSFGSIGPDGNRRVLVAQTHRFRGRRQSVA